jgi:energy-coupling factor transporter transmembrane protein EcfT
VNRYYLIGLILLVVLVVFVIVGIAGGFYARSIILNVALTILRVAAAAGTGLGVYHLASKRTRKNMAVGLGAAAGIAVYLAFSYIPRILTVILR